MEPTQTELKPTWREFLDLIGPAFGWFGAQVALCLQAGFATPYLLELGLTTSNVNWVWIAGPISGIFVQPIVGSYSDILKQRKPFIIVGSITLIIFLVIFSNCKHIGRATNSQQLALILAIISVWMIDVSINCLMAPLRALASDTVNAEKQIYSMSWFAFFAGVAHIVGFLLGATIPNIRLVYLIGSIIIFISCCGTVFTVRTEYVDKKDNNNDAICLKGLINVYTAISRLPKLLLKLMHTQFWTFIGFISMWVYLTDYYGENLLNGDVHSKEGSQKYNEYQLGVQYGNLGYTIQGVVILITAYFSPKIAHLIGMKIFWIISYIVYGGVLCATPWISNLYLFIALHGITGMSFAAFMVYPWSIATRYTCTYDAENAGLLLTTYHLSACLPVLVAAFVSGFIIDAFNGDVSSILFIGGISAFIAAVTVIFVDTEYTGESLQKYSTIPANDDMSYDEEQEPMY
eukprot:39770_1